jgi:hypothetical protein
MLQLLAAVVGGAYMFGVGIYLRLSSKIDEVRVLVTNHHEHRFEELEERVKLLERMEGYHGPSERTHP